MGCQGAVHSPVTVQVFSASSSSSAVSSSWSSSDQGMAIRRGDATMGTFCRADARELQVEDLLESIASVLGERDARSLGLPSLAPDRCRRARSPRGQRGQNAGADDEAILPLDLGVVRVLDRELRRGFGRQIPGATAPGFPCLSRTVERRSAASQRR